MSCNNISHNSYYQSELAQFSSNPQLQQMIAGHLKTYGSLNGICNAAYGSSSSSTSSNSRNYANSGNNSPNVGSNGKYMVHCYYGCQPGNKITTVIG